MSIAPEPGTIIDDRFEIIENVGEGGMGTVYRARQVGLNRVVALKLLHSSLIGDADSRIRFQREGKVLSAIGHPCLPVFYHFGLWQSQLPYIAMEFLEGMSMRRIIDEQGRVPWPQVVNIGLQASRGIAAAHAHGVIHRDLKPNNIMLVGNACQPQQVKIFDFGLASICEKPNEQKLTNTGMLIGSVHYMSPEQCIGRKVDQRSDIYSLACLLYEALAGAPPLMADSPIGLMHKHAHESPKLLQDILKAYELPPVRKCLFVLFIVHAIGGTAKEQLCANC